MGTTPQITPHRPLPTLQFFLAGFGMFILGTLMVGFTCANIALSFSLSPESYDEGRWFLWSVVFAILCGGLAFVTVSIFKGWASSWFVLGLYIADTIAGYVLWRLVTLY